VRLRVR